MEFIKNNHNRDRTVVHRLNSQSFEYSYQSMGTICQNPTVSAYPLEIQLHESIPFGSCCIKPKGRVLNQSTKSISMTEGKPLKTVPFMPLEFFSR